MAATTAVATALSPAPRTPPTSPPPIALLESPRPTSPLSLTADVDGAPIKWASGPPIPPERITSPPPMAHSLSTHSLTGYVVPRTFADGSSYVWSQTDDQVAVSFVVGGNGVEFRSEDAVIEFSNETIFCRIRGEREPRVKGRLFASINRFDSLWQIERSPQTGEKLLTIHLEKSEPNLSWPTLIKTGINDEVDVDPQSLYSIGSNHHSDLGMPRKALELITLAAERGSIAAQLKLAAWYEIGRGEAASIPVDRDPSQALKWHKRAGEMGNAEASYIVGTCYLHGTHGLSVSYMDALTWFRRCLESDERLAETQPAIFVPAAFQAGLILMEGGHGLGDPQPRAAADLWARSASVGHAQSAWNLGIFYLNGWGLDRDIAEGVRWIRTAMAADSALTVPPQLDGLSSWHGLDALVAVSEECKQHGEELDLAGLVELAKERLALDGGKSEGIRTTGTHPNDAAGADSRAKAADSDTKRRVGGTSVGPSILLRPTPGGVLAAHPGLINGKHSDAASNRSSWDAVSIAASEGSTTSSRRVKRKRRRRKSRVGAEDESSWVGATVITGLALSAAIGLGTYIWWKYYKKEGSTDGWTTVVKKVGAVITGSGGEAMGGSGAVEATITVTTDVGPEAVLGQVVETVSENISQS
ncbi:hypothetical protein BJ742DRAFT_778887 [Cladochytrium replicatum]|nr:hypothetical protein BJ742DRAFT_778887 [Cladochytrium replicatum]